MKLFSRQFSNTKSTESFARSGIYQFINRKTRRGGHGTSSTAALLPLQYDILEQLSLNYIHKRQEFNTKMVSIAAGKQLTPPLGVSNHILSSARNLAVYTRNFILRSLPSRKQDVFLKKVLNIVDARQDHWKSMRYQTSFVEANAEQLRYIKAKLNFIKPFSLWNSDTKAEYVRLNLALKDTELASQYMEKRVVYHDLHPEGKNDDLTTAGHKISGMRIRLVSPGGGEEKIVKIKDIGNYTKTDSTMVTEIAKVDLPTLIGTTGLNLRIVYGKKERLLIPNDLPSKINAGETAILFSKSYPISYYNDI